MKYRHSRFLKIASVWLIAIFGISYVSGQDGKDDAVVSTPGDTEPYRLQPGDVIELRLFFNPELNERVQIRPDGRISLQLLGEAEVAWKSIQEAVTMLEERYAKELRTPSLTIQVLSFATQQVFVTGEVETPGVINMPGAMTILEAISAAGGVRKTGDKERVVLIRKGQDGGPLGREISLFTEEQPSLDALAQLHPFDVLIIPETKIARLDRWVDQHIRQLIPFNLSVGFTYLWQNVQSGMIPVF